MAGGSEDGNESSRDLSSSLSISSWLFCAVCPRPLSSRCRSSPLPRLVVPPRFPAMAIYSYLRRAPIAIASGRDGSRLPRIASGAQVAAARNRADALRGVESAGDAQPAKQRPCDLFDL